MQVKEACFALSFYAATVRTRVLTMHQAERLIATAYSQAQRNLWHHALRCGSSAQYLTDGQNCVWPCSYKYALLSAFLGDYISSPSIHSKRPFNSYPPTQIPIDLLRYQHPFPSTNHDAYPRPPRLHHPLRPNHRQSPQPQPLSNAYTQRLHHRLRLHLPYNMRQFHRDPRDVR
jgi:hypothetical protein